MLLISRSWMWIGAMVVACTLVGCGGDPKPAPQKPGDAHDHPDTGPHKGALIELGDEEYHAEFIHDDATHTMTVYILDSKAKGAVPIASPDITLNLVVGGKPESHKLPASPEKTDPAGESSRFSLQDEAVCKALDDEKTTTRVLITIKDKQYSGEVKHDAHEHK